MLDCIKSVFTVDGDTSPAGTLDMNDIKKLARNGLIVGAAACITYFSTHLGGLNFGEYTIIVVPVIAGGLDLLYKWLKHNSPTE